MYKKGFKIVFDFIVASTMLLILSPLFALITLILLIANGGKPFFLQKRPGKKETIFTIIKFRTMNNKLSEEGEFLPDDQRLTAIGKIIRATSLDEIPQLLNVIKGEMSLVGPRPLLPQYLPWYNSFQRKRHDVKPGITGWAQVNGRNAISWNEKFELDVFYVENLNFLFDLKIILWTIGKVFKSEGISDSETKTVINFKGNENKE